MITVAEDGGTKLMTDMGGLYNWLKDRGDEKLALSDLASANYELELGSTTAAWLMLRAQARAFYQAASEIRADLKRVDPRGDWRRWEDKQYWSH
jgi:hypothetical protein